MLRGVDRIARIKARSDGRGDHGARGHVGRATRVVEDVRIRESQRLIAINLPADEGPQRRVVGGVEIDVLRFRAAAAIRSDFERRVARRMRADEQKLGTDDPFAHHRKFIIGDPIAGRIAAARRAERLARCHRRRLGSLHGTHRIHRICRRQERVGRWDLGRRLVCVHGRMGRQAHIAARATRRGIRRNRRRRKTTRSSGGWLCRIIEGLVRHLSHRSSRTGRYRRVVRRVRPRRDRADRRRHLDLVNRPT